MGFLDGVKESTVWVKLQGERNICFQGWTELVYDGKSIVKCYERLKMIEAKFQKRRLS
jgi:hypothetical protein